MKTNRKTPQWVVDKMWDKLVSDIDLSIYDNRPKLLEPSAGEGHLLEPDDYDFQYAFDSTAIELNNEKCEALKEKQYPHLNVIHGDFLNLIIEDKFDVVIAAPPFNNNVDLEHIKKMYSLLSNNGIIVSLTTPYWMTNNEPHQVEFRNWLKDKTHSIEMLPDMTFVEKGKTVPTAIITIYK